MRAAFEFGDLDAWLTGWDGIEAVLTADDIPGENRFGVIPQFADQPVFAQGIARFRGEAVAAVVGSSEAMRAFDAADFPVEWRELPAALTPAATRSIAACAVVRISGEKVRSVAASCPESGMMLSLVPAVTRPTVRTTESKASKVRVTIVCSASTISQTTGTGSALRCGVDPCPPRPETVIVTVSAPAINGPGRADQWPRGSSEERRVGKECRSRWAP